MTTATLLLAIAGIAAMFAPSVEEPAYPAGSVVARHGALRVEGSQRLFVARRGGEWQERTPAQSLAIPASLQGQFPIATVYLGQALRAYADGDRAALAPGATFVDGLQIQRLLDALHQSVAANGAWVAVKN